MKIYFATDHAGFEMKEELLQFVRDELNHEVEDCGAFELDPQDDYPDFISKAAQKVSDDVIAGKESKAIILGGSGQGEVMVANRYKGVRATVLYDGNVQIIKLSREHNDANVLSLGARFLMIEEAKEIVRMWLSADFSNDQRHSRRIAKIDINN